jgi:hypothetical protein
VYLTSGQALSLIYRRGNGIVCHPFIEQNMLSGDQCVPGQDCGSLKVAGIEEKVVQSPDDPLKGVTLIIKFLEP